MYLVKSTFILQKRKPAISTSEDRKYEVCGTINSLGRKRRNRDLLYFFDN